MTESTLGMRQALHLREAGPEDAPAIHSLIRGLAEYEREPAAVEVDVATLRAQLSQAAPPFACLLALRAERAVGFALYFFNYSTWKGKPGLYLEDLYVVESERGLGTGRALMQRLAQIALAQGCARFEWSVLDWNAPAIGFYQRLGGAHQREWQSYRLDGDALARLAGAADDAGARS